VPSVVHVQHGTPLVPHRQGPSPITQGRVCEPRMQENEASCTFQAVGAAAGRQAKTTAKQHEDTSHKNAHRRSARNPMVVRCLTYHLVMVHAQGRVRERAETLPLPNNTLTCQTPHIAPKSRQNSMFEPASKHEGPNRVVQDGPQLWPLLRQRDGRDPLFVLKQCD
jgi:hypothetical protein